MARRVGADFAMIRVWGSIGFVVATIAAGVIVDVYGLEMFLPLLAAVGVIRALVSLRLPLFKAPALQAAAATRRRRRSPLVATRAREIWRPWFILPLAGVALVHGSHMMQMAFGALIWQRAGVPEWIIGPLWAVGPAGEVFVMLAFARLARRFSARHLILAASLVTILRWIGFAMEPPIWGLFVLQAMNMASFGLSYLGIVNFIANWTSEGIAAEAQSTFQAMRQVVTVAALTMFGVLMAQFGSAAFYGAAIMAALGAMLTVVSLFLMPVRHEQRQRSI
jgi:PPP family 3-phenylpropionic acid transporter